MKPRNTIPIGARHRLTVFALSVLLTGCADSSSLVANKPDAPATDVQSPADLPSPDGTTQPNVPPLTTDCRPVDHVWNPANEPMLLPCEPTTEPCDGVDNDADGFTDPHCTSIPCAGDKDCTYGGLLPDADCNLHASPSNMLGDVPAGVCNQIDGVPSHESHEYCWGMLCPPTLKCVQGECIEPGTGAPGAPCTSGADCPLNAGCIPTDEDGVGAPTGRCEWYCHEFDCPSGTECITHPWTNPETQEEGFTAVCDDCVPSCAGKTCGDDGCGGECPDLCGDLVCDPSAGECVSCQPSCEGKFCGDDGCGGECPDQCGESKCNPESGQCEGSTIVGDGACTNPADLAALASDSIKDILFQCAEEWTGDQAAAVVCLTELAGIGTDCASCYGDMLGCMFGDCKTQCVDGSTDCNSCLETHCSAPFATCSGLKLIE